jgi:hypothetical protein
MSTRVCVIFIAKIITNKGFINNIHTCFEIRTVHLCPVVLYRVTTYGNVVIHDNTYIINECLFDSGAESDNFIAKSFIEKNCDIFAEYISPHDCNIRLGDSKTNVHISEIISLSVAFVDSNFISHDAVRGGKYVVSVRTIRTYTTAQAKRTFPDSSRTSGSRPT